MLVELNVGVILICQSNWVSAGVYSHGLGEAGYFQSHTDGPNRCQTYRDGQSRVFETRSFYSQDVLAGRDTGECKFSILIGFGGEGAVCRRASQQNIGTWHNGLVWCF